MITPKFIDDRLVGLDMNIGLGGPMVQLTQSVQPWQAIATILDTWGLHYCQKCGGKWYPIVKNHVGQAGAIIAIYAYGCASCKLLCARTRFGGDLQWWDNFGGIYGGHMPLLVTFPEATFDVCLESKAFVASEGKIIGIYTTGSWLVGMAPYGLDVLTHTFERGRQTVARLVQEHQLAVKSAWPEYLNRTARQDGWLIIDTEVNPLNIRPYEECVKRGEMRWGAFAKTTRAYASLKPLAKLLPELTAALADPAYGGEQRPNFLRALQRLGWGQSWKAEDWNKKVAGALAPFGEPAKVLKPRKVLGARG